MRAHHSGILILFVSIVRLLRSSSCRHGCGKFLSKPHPENICLEIGDSWIASKLPFPPHCVNGNVWKNIANSVNGRQWLRGRDPSHGKSAGIKKREEFPASPRKDRRADILHAACRCGRKVNPISLDGSCAPPKSAEQTRRLVESDEVALIFSSIGTAKNTAIANYLQSKNVQQLFIGNAMALEAVLKACGDDLSTENS
ncbi:hypothetical protein V1280_004990 [Bradyrhizobium sp. AZCC 2230]